MPITKPVLALDGGSLLACIILLGVQVSGSGGFLLPLIASILATLAHLGLGVFWIARKRCAGIRGPTGALLRPALSRFLPVPRGHPGCLSPGTTSGPVRRFPLLILRVCRHSS